MPKEISLEKLVEEESKKTYLYRCKKCGIVIRLPGTKSQLERFLDSEFFDCPGFHVELLSPRNYLEYLKEEEYRRPLSDEEVLEELKKQYPSCRIMRACDMPSEGVRHVGFGFFESDKYFYERRDCPSGNRWYIEKPKK